MVIMVIEDVIVEDIIAIVVGHGTVIVGVPTEDIRGITNGVW